ncbi:70 kDa peptidyl-prolyl isomerase-like isoform X2 [Aristolochia californica]|uniref:70 kDa peptidyl-prolyl isomerase-like isoform X2 n=1 Tax=Aristolochia californica TaxID=171875 RepID=UPI0035DF671A
MVVFSSAAARAINVSGIDNSSDSDEEPGEVIESAPPLNVGEEREINKSGMKKKLVRKGRGWESPAFGDEVTVHYVGASLDGATVFSTKDRGEPLTIKLGHGDIAKGLDDGIITMKIGETALFTLPFDRDGGVVGGESNPSLVRQFEVELISWIPVTDICKDGGIIKRLLSKGYRDEQPDDLDEVTVKYEAKLADGYIVARSPVEGFEFYIKDGHLCPALPKVLKTMTRGEKAAVTVQPQYAFGEQGMDTNNEFSSVPSSATLYIDIELVSFKPVIDVTGDSKILKKILNEGEGIRHPNEGSTVSVRYTGLLDDGTIFEKKGFEDGAPFQFVIDEEQVVAALDKAAATMKKGEKSVVTVKPELGFGNKEVKQELAVIPASSTVIYEVEMVDFTKEKEPFEMDSLERVEAAEKKKEEGNKFFKSGNYWQAAKRYVKAADYVSEDKDYGDEVQKQAKSLRVSCWLNHAACSLKLNDFPEVVKLCSKVLDVESHNIKALFRRAQAFMELSDLNLTELDIKKALEVDPDNREVKSLLKMLKQRKVESNKKDAKLYSNMFSQMKETEMESKVMSFYNQ